MLLSFIGLEDYTPSKPFLVHHPPHCCRVPSPSPRPPTQKDSGTSPRFHHPKSLVMHRAGHDPEYFDRPPLGVGYAHELIEVTEALRAGRTESDVMPLSDTLAVQRIMNSACEQLGVFHAEDPDAL